jgi:hypothetical protein
MGSFISSLLLGFLLQSTPKHSFSNSEFLIQYSLIQKDSSLYVIGLIQHIETKKAAINTNIWANCLFSNGFQSGTVPDSLGRFKLEIPQKCNEIYFFKYGFSKVSLVLKK